MKNLLSRASLIFDLDGTVADTMNLHRNSWTAFGAAHGFAADHPEILASSRGRTTPESMRVLFPDNLDEAGLQQRLEEKREMFWADAQTKLKPIDGFEVFAEWVLLQQRPRALGTAGESLNVARILDVLGLADFFQSRVTGDLGLRGKPEPDIFLRAAQDIGAKPADCVVFEDAIAGVEAARRAGMRCVAVCSDHTAQELAGPHVIAAITDYRQLLSEI